MTAKLEVKLINAKSSPSSTTTPSPTLLTPPGCQDSRDRQRPHRSAARRTKANARAAQHRLHQALPFPGGDYTAAVGPPPPRRPLHLHPSPPKEENRRLVSTVKRKAGSSPLFPNWMEKEIRYLRHLRHHLPANLTARFLNNTAGIVECALISALNTLAATATLRRRSTIAVQSAVVLAVFDILPKETL